MLANTTAQCRGTTDAFRAEAGAMSSAQPLVAALDLGTTGVRCFVFDSTGRRVCQAYRELPLGYPQPGWVEQDPEGVIRASVEVCRDALRQGGILLGELSALGITNQRETVVAWTRETLEPVYPAIVWQDRRTTGRCQELVSRGLEERIRGATGLPPDPYFSSTKIAWLLEHVDGLAPAVRAGDVAFGTMDTWLLANLCGVHATDTTNASRTQLLNLRSLSWDPDMLAIFGVPAEALPEVRPSLSVFGKTDPQLLGASIPVAGVLGDQQAALFGQACIEPGLVKVTWGTGAFLLTNVGPEPQWSSHGLLSTVAFTAEGRSASYALEGSVFIAGAAIQWLRDGLGILDTAGQSEELARTVASTDGVYFVPALVGLGAPHWDPTARGAIFGLTRGSTRAHIVRAALEAVAYQTHDVVRAMEHDAGTRLSELRVDGGASANDFLCQFQSDVSQVSLVRPQEIDTTALGAALAAGTTVGVWPDPSAAMSVWCEARRYNPEASPAEIQRLLKGWHRAVERSSRWEADGA